MLSADTLLQLVIKLISSRQFHAEVDHAYYRWWLFDSMTVPRSLQSLLFMNAFGTICQCASVAQW